MLGGVGVSKGGEFETHTGNVLSVCQKFNNKGGGGMWGGNAGEVKLGGAGGTGVGVMPRCLA